jgi:hypothetical protein
MTAQEWLEAFAERLGVDAPDPETTAQLLELAGVAAHSSERTAAPIACYLIGLARTDLNRAMSAAQEVGGGARG